jgi:hypothetical protein
MKSLSHLLSVIVLSGAFLTACNQQEEGTLMNIIAVLLLPPWHATDEKMMTL